MLASTLIELINRFELLATGHPTLEGGMIAAFGFDWELTSEYKEVADYVSKFMSYDSISGDWY